MKALTGNSRVPVGFQRFQELKRFLPHLILKMIGLIMVLGLSTQHVNAQEIAPEDSVFSHQQVHANFENGGRVLLSPDKLKMYVFEKFNRYNKQPRLHTFTLSSNTKPVLKQSLDVPDALAMCSSADGRFFYLLTSRGSIIGFEATDQGLKELFTTDKENYLFDQGQIHISKDGKFLYQTAGKHCYSKQLMHVFSINPSTAALKLLQTYDSDVDNALEGASDIIVRNNNLYVSTLRRAGVMTFEIKKDGQLDYQSFTEQAGDCPGVTGVTHLMAMDGPQNILASASQIGSGWINFFSFNKDGTLAPVSKYQPKKHGYVKKMEFNEEGKSLIVLKNRRVEFYQANGNGEFSLAQTFNLILDGRMLSGRDFVISNQKIYVICQKRLVSLDFKSGTVQDRSPAASTKKKVPYATLSKVSGGDFVKTAEDSISNSESLLEGIRLRDETRIVRSIKSGVDVNRPDEYGATPLMWAFYTNQPNVAKLLVQLGAHFENRGVIYRDWSFENFYGNILYVCLARKNSAMLKYAVEELKIPWNDRQFDPYTNRTSGNVALSSFLYGKITARRLTNDDRTAWQREQKMLMKSNQLTGASMSEFLNARVERRELNEIDIENCQYLIDKITNSSEKEVFEILLSYAMKKDRQLLNHAISLIDKLDIAYLKLLQTDLIGLTYTDQRSVPGGPAFLRNWLDLSRASYGMFHPKTIERQEALGAYLLDNTKLHPDSIEVASNLLMKCLRQRVTRYGLYHPLTEESFDLMKRVQYRKNSLRGGNGFYQESKYDKITYEIHEKINSFFFRGVTNPHSARDFQNLSRAGVDFSDISLSDGYYRNYNKNLAQRFRAFLTPRVSSSLYFPDTPKEFLDPLFLSEFISRNFDNMSDFSLGDSTALISNMTNIYNALYTYRKDARQMKIEPEYIKELDNYLLNMQLTIKGAKLSTIANSLEWDHIASGLGQEEAAIEIVRFNTTDFQKFVYKTQPNKVNYLCFIIRKDNTSPIVIPLSIDKKFEDNYRSLQSNTTDRFSEGLINLVSEEQTGNRIWSMLANHLNGINRLYISADGIFHQFPIEVLKTQKEGLVFDRFEIIRLTNLSRISSLKANNRNVQLQNLTASLFGNPSFFLKNVQKPGGAISTNSLPETQFEINDIDSLLSSNGWQTEKWNKERASEENFKRLKSPTVIHIATHGGYKFEDLNTPFRSFENSFLKFSGFDNYQNDTQTDKNGSLDGTEVLKMNLSNTDLVVLSACETGVGSAINGEGIMGISRAFLIAGVNSTLSTLWKVNSDLTREFMLHFYQALISTRNKFTAFGKAKAIMKSKYENPYFWAGYIMTS